MEAKEIRIGNFLHHSEMGMVEVIAIGKDYIHCVFNGETFYESIRCFSPIPLSEEILLKAGFYTTTWDNHSTYRFLFCSSAAIVISLEHGYIEIGDLTLDVEIKFLHSLQNLYFALTGKELDINTEK